MTDCTIVGAGIIGSTIAWRLAQQGLRVTLFDAGRMGGEASTAGAGMLAPGGEVHEGSELADLLVRSLRGYGSFVEELAADSGVPVDYRSCGAIEVACAGEELDAMDARSLVQRTAGIASEAMALSDLPLGITPGVRGARFYPDDALVDPAHVMSALRSAVVGRGVDLREGCAVETVSREGRSFRLRDVLADSVVIAAGAWSSQIEIEQADLPRAFPVKGHLVGFDLPVGSLPAIVRRGHTYVLQRSSGFTIAGASTEHAGFDKALDESVVAAIEAEANLLLPGLFRGIERSRAWTGLRPASDSPAPIIRRWEDSRLWLAYGHYRNGILAAPETAARIAREIISSLGRD
jgi:glycine oxidase